MYQVLKPASDNCRVKSSLGAGYAALVLELVGLPYYETRAFEYGHFTFPKRSCLRERPAFNLLSFQPSPPDLWTRP